MVIVRFYNRSFSLAFFHRTVYNITCNLKREENDVEAKTYNVTKIEGEYAYLSDGDGEELFIAMALLPLGVDVGSRLIYENFEFSVVE